MIAWMFQLPGRLLFDKLHGGSNQVNPLEVKQSCWEVRKKASVGSPSFRFVGSGRFPAMWACVSQ